MDRGVPTRSLRKKADSSTTDDKDGMSKCLDEWWLVVPAGCTGLIN